MWDFPRDENLAEIKSSLSLIFLLVWTRINIFFYLIINEFFHFYHDFVIQRTSFANFLDKFPRREILSDSRLKNISDNSFRDRLETRKRTKLQNRYKLTFKGTRRSGITETEHFGRVLSVFVHKQLRKKYFFIENCKSHMKYDSLRSTLSESKRRRFPCDNGKNIAIASLCGWTVRNHSVAARSKRIHSSDSLREPTSSKGISMHSDWNSQVKLSYKSSASSPCLQVFLSH